MINMSRSITRRSIRTFSSIHKRLWKICFSNSRPRGFSCTSCVFHKSDLEYWEKRWDNNHIAFHKPEVHPILKKCVEKVWSDGMPENIFVPLCGKSLDMKWFGDQGIDTVGIDGVQSALEQFFIEHGLKWKEQHVSALGPTGKLLSSKDGTFKLYSGDVLKFTKEIAGSFDAVYDRGSVVAIDRGGLQRYVEVMKGLVKPGGRILLELLQFDLAIMDDVTGPEKPPPPWPMYEKDLKSLYEPEFTVQYLDQAWRKLQEKDIILVMYVLVRK